MQMQPRALFRGCCKERTPVLHRLGIYDYSFSATVEVVVAMLLLIALVVSVFA